MAPPFASKWHSPNGRRPANVVVSDRKDPR
jgi:hypothetical protein